MIKQYHNYIGQIPTHILIMEAYENWLQLDTDMLDTEFNLRKPDEAEVYFGDCDDRPVFYPIQHFDQDGNEIEEVIYDEVIE